MGQKVNPRGLRLGINTDWNANWYANKKNFSKYLKCDVEIRKFILNDFKLTDVPKSDDAVVEDDKLKKLGTSTRISKVVISRSLNYVRVAIYTGRPSAIIGEKGAGSTYIKQKIVQIVKQCGCIENNGKMSVILDIIPIKSPDSDAQLVAMDIASQLEKRTSFRRAMKSAMQRAKKVGVKGIKTMVAGRLDGNDIARTEQYHDGTVPLHTLRADIDYGFAEAATTYGRLGVKVWIYKGEVFKKKTTEGGAN